ncbi:secreted RxLR effector protein 161-like [Henckelia pumila]|uniref:secreted RxLR effector protein 161-like n=1 Tax=Henckelia pumila TaxID=405737 RepID=UPI003C6E2382
MACIPYVSGVGSLIYGMVCSGPDLEHAISVVSRFTANRGTYHWEDLKWILRYLINTSGLGLKFEKQQDGIDLVIGYVDSDFAGNLDTRKSLTGYVSTLLGSLIYSRWLPFLSLKQNS